MQRSNSSLEIVNTNNNLTRDLGEDTNSNRETEEKEASYTLQKSIQKKPETTTNTGDKTRPTIEREENQTSSKSNNGKDITSRQPAQIARDLSNEYKSTYTNLEITNEYLDGSSNNEDNSSILSSSPSTEDSNILTGNRSRSLPVENIQPRIDLPTSNLSLGVSDSQSVQRRIYLDRSNLSVALDDSVSDRDLVNVQSTIGTNEDIALANTSGIESSSEISSKDNINISTDSISNEVQRGGDANTNEISSLNEINVRDKVNNEVSESTQISQEIEPVSELSVSDPNQTSQEIQRKSLESISDQSINTYELSDINSAIVENHQNALSVNSNDFQQDNSSRTIQRDILNDSNLDYSNQAEIIQTNYLFNNTDSQTIQTKSNLSHTVNNIAENSNDTIQAKSIRTDADSIDINIDDNSVRNSDNNTDNISSSDISIQKASNISEVNPKALSQSLTQNIDNLDLFDNSNILNVNTNISRYTENINTVDNVNIQDIQRKSGQNDHTAVAESFNTNNSQITLDSDRISIIQQKTNDPQIEPLSQSEIFPARTRNQLEEANELTVIQRLSDPANFTEDLTLPTVLQNLGQTEPLSKFSSLTNDQPNHQFTKNNLSNPSSQSNLFKPSQLLQAKGDGSDLSSSINNKNNINKISSTPTSILPKYDQNQNNDDQESKSPSWSNIGDLLAKMPPPKVSSNPSTNSLNKKAVSSSDRSSLASQPKSIPASTSKQTQTIIQRSLDDSNDDDLDLYITPTGMQRGNPNQVTNSQVNTIQRQKNSNQGNENLPEAKVSMNNFQDDKNRDAANFEKNLTTLAQEIYVLLQQRLEIEKERQGSRYQGRLPW